MHDAKVGLLFFNTLYVCIQAFQFCNDVIINYITSSTICCPLGIFSQKNVACSKLVKICFNKLLDVFHKQVTGIKDSTITKALQGKLPCVKVDFQSSHEAPRSSLRVMHEHFHPITMLNSSF